MSKYTTQLRWIVEQEQGKIPASTTTRYTKATYRKLGLDEYPIFEEAYRKQLNDKIIDHFFFREIGFETAAQFSWYMRRTMNEIMPYFNELYNAQLMVDDPMTDYARKWFENWKSDTDDTGTVKDSGTVGDKGTVKDVGSRDTEFEGEGENHNRNVFQDTPMSLLDNSTSPTVQGLDYATTVTYDDGSNESSSTTNVDIANTRTTDMKKTTDMNRKTDMNRHDVGEKEHVDIGRNKSQAALMKEYLEVFGNIDIKVLRKLETLFMGLW